LCAQVLSDHLRLRLDHPTLSADWQQRLTGQPGIRHIEVRSGQLQVTYDLRYWTRAELMHRICSSAA
jgi:hypothetical protein